MEKRVVGVEKEIRRLGPLSRKKDLCSDGRGGGGRICDPRAGRRATRRKEDPPAKERSDVFGWAGPMMAVTDRSWRRFARLYTEMVDNALVENAPFLSARGPGVAARREDPGSIGEATSLALGSLGERYVNVGARVPAGECPPATVATKNSFGARFMLRLKRVWRPVWCIVSEMVRRSSVPVSVKHRLGTDVGGLKYEANNTTPAAKPRPKQTSTTPAAKSRPKQTATTPAAPSSSAASENRHRTSSRKLLGIGDHRHAAGPSVSFSTPVLVGGPPQCFRPHPRENRESSTPMTRSLETAGTNSSATATCTSGSTLRGRRPPSIVSPLPRRDLRQPSRLPRQHPRTASRGCRANDDEPFFSPHAERSCAHDCSSDVAGFGRADFPLVSCGPGSSCLPPLGLDGRPCSGARVAGGACVRRRWADPLGRYPHPPGRVAPAPPAGCLPRVQPGRGAGGRLSSPACAGVGGSV